MSTVYFALVLINIIVIINGKIDPDILDFIRHPYDRDIYDPDDVDDKIEYGEEVIKKYWRTWTLHDPAIYPDMDLWSAKETFADDWNDDGNEVFQLAPIASSGILFKTKYTFWHMEYVPDDPFSTSKELSGTVHLEGPIIWGDIDTIKEYPNHNMIQLTYSGGISSHISGEKEYRVGPKMRAQKWDRFDQPELLSFPEFDRPWSIQSAFNYMKTQMSGKWTRGQEYSRIHYAQEALRRQMGSTLRHAAGFYAFARPIDAHCESLVLQTEQGIQLLTAQGWNVATINKLGRKYWHGDQKPYWKFFYKNSWINRRYHLLDDFCSKTKQGRMELTPYNVFKDEL